MKTINKRELLSLRKEVNSEIREIKSSIKSEEKRDEFSRKVDRLYDRLEGNELLLDAIDMVSSEIKGQRLSDNQLQNIIKEFSDAVDFADRNGSSFSSKDILDRVLVSGTNENFKSRKKRIKESKVSSDYANLWKDALEMALEELESDHYGEMNSSEEMYFMLTDNYGEELGYQGFAAFDRVEGDNLIMHTVYPESVSVLSSAERFLEASEEPDIDVSAISSEQEKSDALEKIDNYIESLESDQSRLKDFQWTDEQVEIAEEMNDHGYIDELEIELPNEEWIDFDEFEDRDDAILNAMKDEIVSSLVGYAESVARKADDVQSDARIEIGDLLDSYLDKISDAKEKRKEIEEIEFDDEEFESVRRRRNLRRVIESRRVSAKKESLRRRITHK